MGFLTFTSGLGLTMYLCCVYCEPGRVPAEWRPDDEAGRSMLELKRKGEGGRAGGSCQTVGSKFALCVLRGGCVSTCVLSGDRVT